MYKVGMGVCHGHCSIGIYIKYLKIFQQHWSGFEELAFAFPELKRSLKWVMQVMGPEQCSF